MKKSLGSPAGAAPAIRERGKGGVWRETRENRAASLAVIKLEDEIAAAIHRYEENISDRIVVAIRICRLDEGLDDGKFQVDAIHLLRAGGAV